jgi:pimeloyl-ACP methyl ester carboxylesterase
MTGIQVLLRRLPVFLCFVFSCLFVFSPIVGHARSGPTEANTDRVTRLVPYGDPSDAGPAGPRIPLILVHGIWITPDWNMDHHLDGFEAATMAGWKAFLDSPSWRSLEGRFTPYIFYFLSNEASVSDLAGSLHRRIQAMVSAGRMPAGPQVILAHSMGGLIARSYAQEHAGSSAPGGARIMALITLATPHHGTPGANCQSREQLSANADARDREFETWRCWGCGNTWTKVMKEIGALLWIKPVEAVSCDEPNRRDLLWDNYDNLLGSGNPDVNKWLRRLNEDTSWDKGLIAYYGTVDPGGETFRKLREKIYRCGFFISVGPRVVPQVLLKKAPRELIHQALLGSSAMMYFGLYKEGYEPVANDGLVPEKSGSFDGHTVRKRVFCPGHDHLHMLAGNGTASCSTGKTLFESLADDLGALTDK